MLEGKGTHFDPAIIDAFIATESEFNQIAKNMKMPSGSNGRANPILIFLFREPIKKTPSQFMPAYFW